MTILSPSNIFLRKWNKNHTDFVSMWFLRDRETFMYYRHILEISSYKNAGGFWHESFHQLSSFLASTADSTGRNAIHPKIVDMFTQYVD